jgi:hypothetical protein
MIGGGRVSNTIPQFTLDFSRQESVCLGSQGRLERANVMFEILFLAFAISALLRWPKDVRRMRERKRSALLSGPEHRISAPAATRTPCRRKPAHEDELSEIGSLSKWPSLRHANDNKHRL